MAMALKSTLWNHLDSLSLYSLMYVNSITVFTLIKNMSYPNNLKRCPSFNINAAFQSKSPWAINAITIQFQWFHSVALIGLIEITLIVLIGIVHFLIITHSTFVLRVFSATHTISKKKSLTVFTSQRVTQKTCQLITQIGQIGIVLIGLIGNCTKCRDWDCTFVFYFSNTYEIQ